MYSDLEKVLITKDDIQLTKKSCISIERLDEFNDLFFEIYTNEVGTTWENCQLPLSVYWMFLLGRISGIREERQRRKHSKHLTET